MLHGPKNFLALLLAGSVLAACASSGTSSNNSDQKALAKNKNGKANVKIEPVKPIRTALSQRPSEINISVNGRVTRTGEVYLLRGLANVFSRGMDTMGAKMVRRGLDARVYNHAAWRELADNIVARKKLKEVSYPIVIMGHSLGANASMQMAKYLGDRGVKVSYVVGFDPTVTTSVGKNVDRVINFYLPNDSNSNIVRKAPGFRGTMKNINVRGVRGVTHTTIEKDAKFHADVIGRTLSLTKKRRKARS
jgi:hypothetical protein